MSLVRGIIVVSRAGSMIGFLGLGVSLSLFPFFPCSLFPHFNRPISHLPFTCELLSHFPPPIYDLSVSVPVRVSLRTPRVHSSCMHRVQEVSKV